MPEYKNYANLLTIVISTYNRPNELNRLLETIYLENFKSEIQIIVINDNSTLNYNDVFNRWSKLDVEFISNKKNNLKVLNLINNRNKINGSYFMMVDDKDSFIKGWYNSLKPFLIANLHTDVIIAANRFDGAINNKIIGNPLEGNTYFEFYFQKGKIGDKDWIIPTAEFMDSDFDYLDIFSNEKIYSEFFIYRLFWFKKMIKINSCLLFHPYFRDGISRNNIDIKISNPKVTEYISKSLLAEKICLKIRIIKLFELWLIKSDGKINLSKKNLLLYSLLKSSFSFHLIQILYIKKINFICKN